MECRIAVAEQYADRTGVVVNANQVSFAVTVHITNGNRVRIEVRRADGIADLCLERAVAVAEQHRDRAGIEICGDQIELAVAIEVADRDRLRTDLLRRESLLRLGLLKDSPKKAA